MRNILEEFYQPDVLMPRQFLRTFESSMACPEVRLMRAVLEDAIQCFQKYIFARYPKEKALFRDAEEWILTPGQKGLFSFDSVCEALQLDPGYLRKGLIEWKRSQSPQVKKIKLQE